MSSTQNSADVEREHQQAAHPYHQADNGGPALPTIVRALVVGLFFSPEAGLLNEPLYIE